LVLENKFNESINGRAKRYYDGTKGVLKDNGFSLKK